MGARSLREGRGRVRRAFELVAALASACPFVPLTGCDVDERIDPTPKVDPSACRGTPFTPTPADTCGAYVHLPCGLPDGTKPIAGPGCYFSIPDCNRICNEIYFSCHATEAHCTEQGTLVPGEDGAVDVDCVSCIGNAGRAFEGQGAPAPAPPGADPIGHGLARMARLEAASVGAFARLGADLADLGAPRLLLGAVARAQRDEARHARVVGDAARRRGARVERVLTRPRARASREEIASENAVEGCVGETLAALLLAWDRVRAEPADVRAVFAEIADDELFHARLSFTLQAWLVRGLAPDARARVAERGLHAAARAVNSVGVRRLPRAARTVVAAALTSLTNEAFSAPTAQGPRS